MPQLDYVSFHYILNTLSYSYLFVYVMITLFLLKPIFNEFFLFYTYPTAVILGAMLLFLLYSDKVVFTALSKHTPDLRPIRAVVRKRWAWYKYIPRMRHPVSF